MSHIARSNFSIFFVALFLLPFQLARAVDLDVNRPEQDSTLLPALGIGETFGRWNDVVKLGYNPAGAPAAFDNADLFLSHLAESAKRWEKISGIKFEILPVGDYVNDRENAQSDGIVSVTWIESDDTFAGRAGPTFGRYIRGLGYFPYVDGSISLRSNSDWSGGSFALTRTLVHEFGHLIGLGHSDNPQSIMFANPYNQLQYPKEDDIRAVQTLYGYPSTPLDVSQSVRDWKYVAPKLASDSKISFLQESETLIDWRYVPLDAASALKTQNLFKPNQNTSLYGKGVMLVLNGDPQRAVARIGSTTSDDSYLIIYAPIGNWNSTESIAVKAQLILVNPLGFVNFERTWSLDCNAGSACVSAMSLNWNRSIKDVPGEWTIYVVEDPEAHKSPQTLYKMNFTVEGSTERKAFFASTTLSVDGSNLTSNRVTESTPNNGWLRVDMHLNNNWSPKPIKKNVELVLLDPSGYLYSKTNRELTCGAATSCSRNSNLVQSEVLKTLPGTWSIYINDAETNEMLHKLDFLVDTQPVFNKSPTARIVVSPTEHPNRIKVKVIAEDAENDKIFVVWDQINKPEALGPSGESEWGAAYFENLGENTLFIQVNDNSLRYPGRTGSETSAGDGFQTLIRLDITLPLTNASHVAITSSSISANGSSNSNLITYITQYSPSSDWPAPYNGVTSPRLTALKFNNIAILDLLSMKLYACARITESGIQSHMDGVERFDINFKVIDLHSGSIQVIAARPFNNILAVNEDYEYPDCSGQYDTSTGLYSDVILLGSDIFEVSFKLVDRVNMTFSFVNSRKIH